MSHVTAEALKEFGRIFGEAREVQELEIGGVTYVDKQLHDPRKKDPAPDPLVVHTLTGLVEYLASELDELDPGKTLVQVVNPTSVAVRSKLQGHFQQRMEFVRAEADDLASGFLDTFHPLDQFIIAVQSRFTESGDRPRVLKTVGNITDEAIRTHTDDGVTQTVSAKAGVKAVEGVEELDIPNPVSLAPYRSFPEIEQTDSEFVLRVRKGHNGPEAALFQADGGAWRVQAIQRIGEWLENQAELGEFRVIS